MAVENLSMSRAAVKKIDLCWSCGTNIQGKDYFCHHCDAVLLWEPDNIFEVLNVEPGFDIDRTQVEKSYFELQRRLHPDNFIGLSPLEIQFSERHATAINKAYSAIKDPLQRAENLLIINGIKVPKDETICDSGLLMEIMEIRESLAEANSLPTIEKIANRVEQDMNESLNDLSNEFGDKRYSKALNSLLRLRYLQKILNDCFNKEHEC